MANLPIEPSKAKRDERAARHSPAIEEEGTSAEADLVGDDLPRPLGRYLLLKRIARGGMGEVLLAATMGIEGAERPAIVKIIRREHKKDPNFHARFLDETRVQAQLSHSGVAQVLDAAIDDRTGEPYAVVEYVEGKSLGEVRQRAVQTGHRILWADAVALTQLIAEGLAYVHERKDARGAPLAIVHRDLSPQNIMVSFAGEVKIIDFGTARGQNRRCHTVAGVVFAKPGYVAPEVANGDSGDARVDLYAVGIMLWELCAGRRFLQGDAQAHLARVARNELDPPKIAAQVGAPEGLDAVIAKLTAFDRDARYLAARTAATDLAKLLGSAPTLASGERGVRTRAAHLMGTLFPGEPLASRRELSRLISAARSQKLAAPAAKPAPVEQKSSAREPKPAEQKPGPKAPPPPAAPLMTKQNAPSKTEDLISLEGSRYRAIKEIGRGASSVVFEAEHETDKRRAAVKVLVGEQGRAAEAVERFRRSARALSLQSHPNLVQINDVGVLKNGSAFCVMELCEGETLNQYIAREKGADYREALGMAAKILSAMEVAHGAGIVHRDIQPANILLTAKGGLKVLDFGLAGGPAIALDKGANGPSGDIIIHGTPEYLAPEQTTSGEVDGRADLYAVGIILFELLTGRVPFEGPSAMAIIDQKRKGSPKTPNEVAPSRAVPIGVSDVVMKAIARHPSARFQSATEMRKAIDRALQAASPRRSRRMVGALTAMTAILVLAFGIGLVKSEKLRSKMPDRVASFLTKTALITAESTPPPNTDLAEVPLGEVAMDAPLQNVEPEQFGPPVASEADRVAAIEDMDPALSDPAENEDVLAAVDPSKSETSDALDEIAPTPEAAAPAPAATPEKPVSKPKTKHRAKPNHKKNAPKSNVASESLAKPKADARPKSNASHANPAKDMAPPKDETDAAGRRKKKKKVRIAKAK